MGWGAAWGQTTTQIDLSTQARNIDFSAASATRPVKTGTVLPVTCKVGDAFFKTNESPGANLFGCTAVNTWSPLGGGGGGGASSSAFQPFISDGRVSSTTTDVSIPAGVYRNNNVVTAVADGTVQAAAGSLAAGAQIWIEFDPVAKTRYVVGNANVTLANLNVVNVVKGSGTSSGFTTGRIPIASCTGGAVADTWLSCTDARTPFSAAAFTAGPGIAIGPADAGGLQQISASVNPLVYRTMVNGTASCPSSETTLQSYQFPVGTGVSAGDSLEILAWFEKTGSATPAIAVTVDGTYANDPVGLGSLTMTATEFAVRIKAVVISSSSIAYTFDAQKSSGTTVLSGAPVFTGATITGTPLVEFRASGCSGGSTVRVLGAVITLYKGANL
ncbi:MAG: hypothetical protein WDO18_02320 [Acidobacteriota bacterium]